MTWSAPVAPGGPPPQRLAEGLDRVLVGLGGPTVDTLLLISEQWPELVGPEAAEALRPVAVDGGCLIASTDSTAWASQSRWLEAGIVERAAELLGEGVISSFATRMRRP